MDSLEFKVGVAAVVVFFTLLGPLLVIWSVNTLFPSLAIAYTFWTWLATFFLMLAFGKEGIQRVKTE